MKGALSDKYKTLTIKKFRKLKKMFARKKKGARKNISDKLNRNVVFQEDKIPELTEFEKMVLEKDENDLNAEDLDLIGDISMDDSDFSSTDSEEALRKITDDLVLGSADSKEFVKADEEGVSSN
jgi:hypothetical protein